MNAPELPDDPSSWPTNPFELLGVPPDTPVRELRRAYTRLIRRFKPEQYPEQFRRIRQAYETASLFAEFQNQFPNVRAAPATHEPNGVRPDGTPSNGGGGSGGDRSSSQTDRSASPPERNGSPSAETGAPSADLPSPSFQPRPSESLSAQRSRRIEADLEDELKILWDRACHDDGIGEAYARMKQLWEAYPQRGDIAARLYWLLRLAPWLEPQRLPRDFLRAGLRRDWRNATLGELLRRDLAEFPDPTLDEPPHAYYEAMPREMWLAVADSRWQLAADRQRWQRLVDDLDYLHQHLPHADELLWVRLLLGAADRFAWAQTNQARGFFRECCAAIARFPRCHLDLAHDLDRLDFLSVLVEQWLTAHRTLPACAPYLSWIAASWNQPPDVVRAKVRPLLERVSRAPAQVLRDLERLQQTAPLVVAQLASVVQLLRTQFGAWESPDDVARRAWVFVTTPPTWYEGFRRRLFEFCLREFVTPEEVADAIGNAEQSAGQKTLAFVETARSDPALNCTCMAYQLFWLGV